jgi:hypothetical protein
MSPPRRRQPRADRAAVAQPFRPVAPGRAALAALAGWLLLLLLAPAGTNASWGVNAFASLGAPARLALLGFAAACAALAWSRARGRWLAPAVAVLAAWIVAFPLRERIHFLGDTNSRIGALSILALDLDPRPLGVWARQIHAQPLDLVVDFLLPARLARLISLEPALSLVWFALAVVFLLGAHRLVRRSGAPPAAVLPLFAAFVLTGSLEVFAGYVDSAGLLLAAGVWWWSDLIGPLRSPAAGVRVAAGWLALLLAHRLGVVMLAPLLWRVAGPAWPGDDAPARRWATAATAAAVVAGGVILAGFGSSERIALDAGGVSGILRDPGAAVRAAIDGANLLLLVASPAIAAAIVAGPAALRAALADPAARVALIAAAALLPLAFLVPAVPASLGGQRDWDIGVLFGLASSLFGVLLLARLPEARLRGALVATLPVLALGAGGWLAVNADERAALARANTAACGWPRMAEAQQSQALIFLGSDLATRGRYAEAAENYERSFDLVPAPNRGLHAATNWARVGEFDEAREVLARVKRRPNLDVPTVAWIRELESQMDSIDALRAGRRPRPAPAAGGEATAADRPGATPDPDASGQQ